MILTLSQQIALLAIAVVNFCAAVYVLAYNPARNVNRAFSIFAAGVSAWLAGLVLVFIMKEGFYDKVIFGGATTLLLGLVLLSKSFPVSARIGNLFWILISPIFAVYAAIPFGFFVEGIQVGPDGSVQPVNAPGLIFFVIAFGFYSAVSIALFIRNYKKSRGSARKQMQYLFLGVGILIASMLVFNVILPALGFFQLNTLGALSSLAFTGCTAYAIIRHHLLDIRVVIQRGMIYTALLSIIIGFYLLLVLLSGFVFQKVTNTAILISAGATIFLGIFGVPVIKHKFEKWTDKIFFKDKYDYGEAVHELSEILSKNIRLEQTLTELSRSFKKIFKVKNVAFLLVPQNLYFEERGGLRPARKFYTDALIRERTKRPDVILHAEIDNEINGARTDPDWRKALLEIKKLGKEYDVEASAPIVLEGKITGFFGLGEKRSGDTFTDEDIRLLKTFSYQAGVALEKARLYEEVRKYSEKLEEKVKERTAKLKKLQEEQRQMMVDISHGLQTPLTIMKGGFDLLKMHIPHDKNLYTFEKSIDDVSKFIYDLLRLAKLETGRDELKKETFDLGECVNDLIEYFGTLAEEKKIAVSSKIAAGITVNADREKIRELAMNLMSNAIKYMKKSGERSIRIELEKGGDTAKLTIADTGIGINKKELPFIFKRFYRVRGKESSLKSGAGLGLAIAKKIAEKHGGTIEVESKLGKGTMFAVTVPLASP